MSVENTTIEFVKEWLDVQVYGLTSQRSLVALLDDADQRNFTTMLLDGFEEQLAILRKGIGA